MIDVGFNTMVQNEMSRSCGTSYRDSKHMTLAGCIEYWGLSRYGAQVENGEVKDPNYDYKDFFNNRVVLPDFMIMAEHCSL